MRVRVCVCVCVCVVCVCAWCVCVLDCTAFSAISLVIHMSTSETLSGSDGLNPVQSHTIMIIEAFSVITADCVI